MIKIYDKLILDGINIDFKAEKDSYHRAEMVVVNRLY